MTSARRLPAAALLAAAAVGLSGCISLFPKVPPAQLYRFEAEGLAPAPAPAPAGAQVAVRLGAIDFAAGAAGDRILTARGNQVAYIENARWDVPADRQFQAAIESGFAAAGGPVRLVAAGHVSEADDRLTLQVSRFEVAYTSAGPQVVVNVRATLVKESDLSYIGEQEFDAAVPASADRVGAFVEAYDAAVSKVVQSLVPWVQQTAVSSAPAPR